MHSYGRSTYEVVLIVLVVGLAVAVSVGIFARRTTLHSERLLISELALLRSRVCLYRARQGHVPPSLDRVLAERPDAAGSLFGGSGRPEDPFGNAYRYDASNGWVRSATEGYGYW